MTDQHQKAHSTAETSDKSTGELVSALTQQVSQLMRGELELAKAEMAQKAKSAGIGAGLFGGAGVTALYAVGALIATVILALAEAMAPWLAGAIVTVVLFVVAGVAAVMGKKKVSAATPPVPEKAVEGIKADIATVKEAGR